MIVNKVTVNASAYPERLRNIASPPKQLFYSGAELSELLLLPCLAVIGSRSVSTYGRSVTARLVREAAEQGVVIISGLALGVDAIAHQAALEVNGQTIAVLPTGLDKIYPVTNSGLAQRILQQGGTLVSEYLEGSTMAFKSNFVARNRIVSGLADAILITEAAEKSGSLHTARFALEQGRDVMAVPGNITSPTSVGTNNLIKSGAVPITSTDDILYILGGKRRTKTIRKPMGRNSEEQALINLMYDGILDGHELMMQTSLDPAIFNQTLTMLEISGVVRPLGGNQWALR